MAEESFMLVSLKEDEAKKLAQVISNDTCRKILDFLAKKKSMTESDIAKELDVPISTVHYNLQHLLKAGLVNADEFHYSEKGKEVNHYSLANKYVIIAPKEVSEGFKEKLKKIIPMGMVAVVGAGAIQLFSMFSRQKMAAIGTSASSLAADAFVKSAEVAEEAAVLQTDSFLESAPATAGAIANATNATSQAVADFASSIPASAAQTIPWFQNIALWFLTGALVAIAVYIVVETIRGRNKKNP